LDTLIAIGGNTGITAEVLRQSPANRIIAYSRNELPADLSSVERTAWDVTEDFPGLPEDVESIDGFIYGPGTINLRPFKSLKLEDFYRDFEINVMGAVKALQVCLPKMTNATAVFFSTVASHLGMSFHSSIVMAKSALEGLIKSLAAEYVSKKVHFYGLALSLVDTSLAANFLSNEKKKEQMADRHPLKRVGSPEEVAMIANDLLVGKYSWMTGQIISLDGGISSIRP
jgi:3-oxoacyl-[acyl-carrier protein] reductase